jgi:hypothetical protein
VGAVDSGYQAAPQTYLGKGLSGVLELVSVLWACEAVIIARPLAYKASDGSDLSPFTPSLFLPDVRELGVRFCGSWDAKSLNKKIDFCKIHSRI